MKTIFVILVSSIICFSKLFSQCEFHENLTFETALIFPLPFGITPLEKGGLGINQEATIGSPFDFKWTMIWPDSFNNATTGGTAFADTLQFFLDQTIWVRDNQLDSMPNGLSFSIDPPSGIVFPNSEAPVACIRLFGTPEADVIPGDYLMTFSVKTCLEIPDVFSGCQDALIPSIISGFPGEYRLKINKEGTVAVKETLNNTVKLRVAPNPFVNKTIIEFNSEGLSDNYLFEVYDLNGALVKSKILSMTSNHQKISLDASGLSAGVYVFQIKGKEGMITSRLVVQK